MINTRNAIVILVLIGFSSFSIAQSDMDDRKFRLGLQASPNLGWFRPDIQGLTKDGLQSRFGFGYGVMVDYKFSDSPNYLLTTGFNITTNGGGMVEAWETTVEESDTSYIFRGTNDRTYRMQYVNIPILLKLRTGDVGYMSYFGAIGFDASFRTRAKANDDYDWTVSPITLQPDDREDIDIRNQMNFMRLALNVTLGAEYNLTGNTNIYLGLGIHNGFTNIFNAKNNNRVLKAQNNGSPELDPLTGNTILSEKRAAKSLYVSLDVGVYF
jgi:hypothetical protein